MRHIVLLILALLVLGPVHTALSEERPADERVMTEDESWVFHQLMRKEPLQGEDAHRLFEVLVKREEKLEAYHYEEAMTTIIERGVGMLESSPEIQEQRINRSPITHVWRKGDYTRRETQSRSGVPSVVIRHPGDVLYEYDVSTDTYVRRDPGEWLAGHIGEARLNAVSQAERDSQMRTLGTEVIRGQEAVIFEMKYPEYEAKPRVWISTATGLRLRTVIEGPMHEGQYTSTTIELLDFTVEDIPGSLFEVPPEKVVEAVTSDED